MALNYTHISSESDLPEALKQIDANFRQIAAENQTKTISQGGGTAMKYGLLGDGTYGINLYDPSNNARIEIGFDDNGQPHILMNDNSSRPLLRLAYGADGKPQT